MMGIDLDRLIEELDPDKINEKVGKPHAKARAKYKSEKIEVFGWEDFRKEIIKYVKHHHKAVYKADIPDDQAYKIALEILEKKKEEGGFGGIQSAYKIAKDGKLQDVINSISAGMEAEASNNWRLYVLHQIDPMDFDAHTNLMKKYIDKYRAILPPKIKTKKPEELAKDYDKLLLAHADIVYQQRGVLKKYEPTKKKAA
jgi:hypothetical protein